MGLALLKSKKILQLLSVLVFCIGLYNIYNFQKKQIRYAHSHKQKDFPAYFIAHKIAQKKENIYNIQLVKREAENWKIRFTEWRANLYPPPFSVLISHLKMHDIYKSQVAFIYLKLLILLVFATLLPLFLTKNLYKGKKENTKYLTLFFSGLIFFFCSQMNAVEADFKDGQVNTLILFLLIIPVFAIGRYASIFIGISISLGSVIKISPIFLTIYYFLKKRYTVIAVIFISGFFFFLWSLYHFGFYINKEYLDKVFIPFFINNSVPVLNWELSHSMNQSIKGLFFRLFVSNYDDPLSGTVILFYAPWLAKILVFLVNFILAYFCVNLTWKSSKKQGDKWLQYLSYSLYIATMPLISPLTWFHHLVVLLIPIVFILFYFSLEDKVSFFLLFLFIFAIVLLVLPPLFLYPDTRARGLSFLNYVKLGSNLILYYILIRLFSFQYLRNS